jgi:lipid-binding SYLF domain-containing protein
MESTMKNPVSEASIRQSSQTRAWRGLRRLALVAVLAIGLLTQPVRAGEKQEGTVRNSRWVYEEVLQSQTRRLPAAILQATKCIAIFPGLKEAAFAFGGRHGTGTITCRNDEGVWSPPAFLKLSAGSFGLQIGYQASDIMMFFVTEKAAQAILEPKFALGGDLSVAAGPYSDTAGVTSAKDLTQDIYIYSRASGLFAGASFEGTRLAMSSKAIRRYYGHYIWPGAILFEHDVPFMPGEAEEFVDGLQQIRWE